MRRHLLAVLVLSMGVVGLQPADCLAATATANMLTVLHQREDGFYNYDFVKDANGELHPYANQVDWGMALLFYNNATIDKVKNSAIGPLYDQEGSTINARMSDDRFSTDYVWDGDKGKKTTYCPGLPTQPRSAYHYRVYADGDDRLYNIDWGYYVIGSTHIDQDECNPVVVAHSGWSEDAEGFLVSQWASRTHSYAENDKHWWHNQEQYRVVGSHVWQNNGYASILRVN